MACLTRCKYCGCSLVDRYICYDCALYIVQLAEKSMKIDEEAVKNHTLKIQAANDNAWFKQRMEVVSKMSSLPISDPQLG
jgi:hypothetical protein